MVKVAPATAKTETNNAMNGIIIKAISGFYYVNSCEKIYECKARGSFRKAGVSPVVGDKVEFSLVDDTHGTIESVCERRNLIIRPLVANIDKLFIVSAYETPSPDTLMIDRLTAIAVYNGIEPIIVFNKCDMGDFSELEHIYKASGFKTYTVSAAENIGVDRLKEEMRECICAFAGNSGVGKSSILNALFPELSLKTGEVSEKLGRGRHTTRHTELFYHNAGGFVADTPGFSSVEEGLLTYDFKMHLPESFPDFADYIDGCRFTSCTHTCEKGCALLDAIKNGDVQQSRHKSYVALYNELKDINKWNDITKGK